MWVQPAVLHNLGETTTSSFSTGEGEEVTVEGARASTSAKRADWFIRFRKPPALLVVYENE